MKNKLTLTGANKLFFAFAGVFLVYQLVMGAVLGTAVYDHMYTIVLINEFAIAAFVIVYCLVKRIDFKETFRLNKLGLVPALLIIVTAVPALFAATMFNNIIVYFLQFIGDIPSQGLPVPNTPAELLVGIAIIGIAPGVCEELMHRGFLLKAYERRGSYKAVVIVSILFGIFHFDITNLLGPIFLGLIIGYYVVRTDSIFAGILAHFLNNALAEVLQYINRGNVRPENITLTAVELMGVITIGIPSLLFTVGLLFAFKKVTEGRAVIIPPISKTRQDVKAVLTHWPVIAVLVLYVLMAMLYIFSIAIARLMGI
ncbi:MAG: CPBP family intramembrane metalloprotease [Clostridiaceae bacterium]|jgi:membrane protease YdiL (CAAX protease family)|nr:CPBP family intramembrane metalloprotease [Clostridiaceae bacterium]